MTKKKPENSRSTALPHFLVNGVAIRGYVSVERFEETVDYVLEKSSKTTADIQDGEICGDCLNQM